MHEHTLESSEIINFLESGFAPNKCFAKSLDHKELYQIKIVAPNGEVIEESEPVPREKLDTERKIRVFILHIKNQLK